MQRLQPDTPCETDGMGAVPLDPQPAEKHRIVVSIDNEVQFDRRRAKDLNSKASRSSVFDRPSLAKGRSVASSVSHDTGVSNNTSRSFGAFSTNEPTSIMGMLFDQIPEVPISSASSGSRSDGPSFDALLSSEVVDSAMERTSFNSTLSATANNMQHSNSMGPFMSSPYAASSSAAHGVIGMADLKNPSLATSNDMQHNSSMASFIPNPNAASSSVAHSEMGIANLKDPLSTTNSDIHYSSLMVSFVPSSAASSSTTVVGGPVRMTSMSNPSPDMTNGMQPGISMPSFMSNSGTFSSADVYNPLPGMSSGTQCSNHAPTADLGNFHDSVENFSDPG